jgi:hypothetical protein
MKNEEWRISCRASVAKRRAAAAREVITITHF